jgi:hypothetical protein
MHLQITSEEVGNSIMGKMWKSFTGENPGKTAIPLALLYSDIITVQPLLH